MGMSAQQIVIDGRSAHFFVLKIKGSLIFTENMLQATFIVISKIGKTYAWDFKMIGGL